MVYQGREVYNLIDEQALKNLLTNWIDITSKMKFNAGYIPVENNTKLFYNPTLLLARIYVSIKYNSALGTSWTTIGYMDDFPYKFDTGNIKCLDQNTSNGIWQFSMLKSENDNKIIARNGSSFTPGWFTSTANCIFNLEPV